MKNQSQLIDLQEKILVDSSDPIVQFLINESSNKLRTFFDLSEKELLKGLMPRIVTRKDPSLDNYFAELLLRTCYPPITHLSEFEEIVVRGDNVELPTNLNPQIKGAILIGIGGQSHNRDFIRSYDEHNASDGTRTVDSASQVVFFAHLNTYRRTKANIHGILPILNELNRVDSEGNAPENHLIQMTKNLHLAQFQSPGYVVEGFSVQLKRAVIDAILASLCLNVGSIRRIDMEQTGEDLRVAWKQYRSRRDVAVKDERLPSISMVSFGKVVNRTTGKNRDSLERERTHPFSLRRIFFALKKTWGNEVALFVVGFLMEALLQLQQEYENGLNMVISPIRIPGTDYSLIYHVMSPSDMRPHRALISRINNGNQKSFVVVKDSHRQIMSIFKTSPIDEGKWLKVINWLNRTEPGRWYCPFNDDTQKHATFILNGTRSYLGSEPSELGHKELIEGLAKLLV